MSDANHHLLVHTLFDILAWLTALTTLLLLRRTWFGNNPVDQPKRFGYLAAVLIGAGVGAWLFGTLNSWLSGREEFARSIEGALAGAIVSIELYKSANGINARTGAIYALPVALGIAVGRIGCLLSGLEDFTYGVPTGANWGWDFGDGILRHPVQLYETIAMAAFALTYWIMVKRGSAFWKGQGFYLAVGFYGLERFVLEFWKPYAAFAAGLTIFQLLSLALILYSVTMLATREKAMA
ncbi:MAG: prolipoprotein diacylglyceryl transferase [Rhizobiaceae bacterium]